MNQNLNLKQQLRCIYTSDFFSGLRITDAVWVALLAARGFSLWEIGLAESVYHIVSLFCEVPSGMAADLLGRRKTLLSGGVLTVTCNLLMAFAPNLFTICLAMGLNALAMTMFSGTFTALVYDSLKTEGREDEYIQVSANSSQISMLANAIGSLASLLKRFLGFAGFYLLSAAFEGVSTAALALMEEPIVTKAQASRGRQTLRALPGQFTKLARNSLSILRTTPLAAKLIVSSAVVSVPSYLTKMFLQQRLIELGWPTELLFLPLLLGGAACVLGAEVGRRVRFRSMRRFYSVCALLCGGALHGHAAGSGLALVGGGGDGGVAHAACGHGAIAVHRGHRAVGAGPAHAGILLISAAHAQGRGRVLVVAAHGQGHGALAQVHSGEEGVLILRGFRSHSGVSRGSLRLRALRISRRGAQEHHAERCRSNAVFQYIFQFHR